MFPVDFREFFLSSGRTDRFKTGQADGVVGSIAVATMGEKWFTEVRHSAFSGN
jgi:hypothetical protein